MEALAAMTQREFEQLRVLIHERTGIALSDRKRDLLVSRLTRRLRARGVANFTSYLALVRSEARELRALINSVTTNKTEFFREAHHFDALRDVLAPRWIDRARRDGVRRVRIWSAGCSTGEEPYTIAMVLHERLPVREGWDVEVVGTDIDSDVLSRAAAAVYPPDRLADVPAKERGYFVRDEHGYRIRDDLRSRVTFRSLNLIAPTWPVDPGFDAIFCRNVIIYFDRPTQQQLFARFTRMLAPEGRMFIGHSESLTGITDELVLEGHTIYRRRAANVPVERLIVGDVRAAAKPVRFTTVLGSCVSVCLFDPAAGVGGLNHFLLPEPPPGEERTARYGVEAMATLLARVIALGAAREALQAKIFGGCGGEAAADANIQFAREWLAGAGIPVAGERVGRRRAIELHVLSRGGAARFREISEGPCPAS